MSRYVHNLTAFKDLLDMYTMADLETMIYKIPNSNSGACGYPALQTLISVMEMLGRLCCGKTDQPAYSYIHKRLAPKYDSDEIVENVYQQFRHGIAHSSLAKGGVVLKKDGDANFHLTENGKNIDVRIMLNDFKKFYEKLFSADLLDVSRQAYYESNLKQIFKQLNLKWLESSDLDGLITTQVNSIVSNMRASCASGSRGPTN